MLYALAVGSFFILVLIALFKNPIKTLISVAVSLIAIALLSIFMGPFAIIGGLIVFFTLRFGNSLNKFDSRI